MPKLLPLFYQRQWLPLLVPPLSNPETFFCRKTQGFHSLHSLSIRLWRHVVQKGDIVVDATCGNGNDTLAMVKLVKDDVGKGCVYGLDLQEDAIKNTSHLLDLSLNPVERKSVKLFSMCHSRMTEVLPKNSSVRLVAFNLGYLPGGDKTIITKSDTTLQALKAATDILVPGGLISVISYVGHPGGRSTRIRHGYPPFLLMKEFRRLCRCPQRQNLKLFKVLLQSCNQKAGLAARFRC